MKIKALNSDEVILLKRALRYIKPYKLKFILAFLCVLSGIVFGLIQPLIWGKLVSTLFEKKIEEVLINVSYLAVIYIFQATTGFLQSYFFSFLSESIIFDLKRDMFKKILDLPVKAFDEIRVGEFISRMHGDASTIASVLTNQLLNTAVDVLRVIFVGVTVFAISLPLALIVICSFPFSYFIFLKYGEKIRGKNKELSSLNDSYFSNIGESILGIREVKSLGIKNQKFELFVSLAKSLRSKLLHISILNTLSQTLSQSINFISQIAVIGVGGYLMFVGSLTMQLYIAFSSYSSQFSFALMNITSLNSNFQQILTSLERIFGLMDNFSYAKEEFGSESISHTNGNIKFENIHFEYTKNLPVLKGISFEISKNRKTAIVGTSGSGKSTVFNLLLKFYSPTSGRILIDGIDLNEFSEESLRSNISIVRQDPFLFKMSIKDNLLLANPLATDDEVQAACEAAFIHEYIMSLPEKYNSSIGENGINLSGGQKQRLAIARALLKKTNTILFDEATSALDNESQFYIRKVFNRLSKNHTIIIIAHSLSTIIEADEIIVIESGKIVGQGTHRLLIQENKVYKRLYESELDLLKSKEVV